jgi:hypothetical protein
MTESCAGGVRAALLMSGAVVAILIAVPAARADRQPNTNIGAGERSAYEVAISAGTPEALRHYLDLYPDDPNSAKVLQLLIDDCGKRLQASGAKAISDPTCDLSELIAPAAGPATPGPGFTDPPTENSGRGRASPQ